MSATLHSRRSLCPWTELVVLFLHRRYRRKNTAEWCVSWWRMYHSAVTSVVITSALPLSSSSFYSVSVLFFEVIQGHILCSFLENHWRSFWWAIWSWKSLNGVTYQASFVDLHIPLYRLKVLSFNYFVFQGYSRSRLRFCPWRSLKDILWAHFDLESRWQPNRSLLSYGHALFAKKSCPFWII